MSNHFRNSDVISIQTDQFPNGLCREGEPEIFFSSPAQAKTVCSFCPHAIACRDAARARGEEFGVWGGEDEGARKDWLRRQRQGQPSARSGRPVTVLTRFNIAEVARLRKLGWHHSAIAKALGMNEKSVFRAFQRTKKDEASA